jgi:hypothetical protein
MFLREARSVPGHSADGEQHEQAKEVLQNTLALISSAQAIDLVVYFKDILADEKSVVDVEPGEASGPTWLVFPVWQLERLCDYLLVL